MKGLAPNLATLLLAAALGGAAAFAACQSSSSSTSTPAEPVAAPSPQRPEQPQSEQAPAAPAAMGHESQGANAAPGDNAGGGSLPPGHPPIGANDPGGAQAPGPQGAAPSVDQAAIKWKAPPRWELVPSASSMRLATYRIPRAPGDSKDGELSVIQAGGTVEANADRWVGQFDADSQKSAKRSTTTVGTLPVTLVEVQGTFNGGMMMPGSGAPSALPGWALLGAIVSAPGSPYFFKLTGPAKTVQAARGEFTALVSSFAPR